MCAGFLLGGVFAETDGIAAPVEAVLALTGCTLLASLDILFPGTSSATGSASTTVPIPNDRAFVAANFYNQYLVIDPTANSGGVVFTDAGKATIGEQ